MSHYHIKIVVADSSQILSGFDKENEVITSMIRWIDLNHKSLMLSILVSLSISIILTFTRSCFISVCHCHVFLCLSVHVILTPFVLRIEHPSWSMSFLLICPSVCLSVVRLSVCLFFFLYLCLSFCLRQWFYVLSHCLYVCLHYICISSALSFLLYYSLCRSLVSFNDGLIMYFCGPVFFRPPRWSTPLISSADVKVSSNWILRVWI